MTPETLEGYLAVLRTERGVTSEDVMRALGYKAPLTLKKRLSGETPWTFREACILSDLLGITLEEFAALHRKKFGPDSLDPVGPLPDRADD